MRVCLVTTEYPPGPMGGVGTYTTILPRLLVDAGHEVTVLTKRFGDALEYENQNGVEVYRLPIYYEYTGAAERLDDELFTLETRYLRSFISIYAREVSRKLPE